MPPIAVARPSFVTLPPSCDATSTITASSTPVQLQLDLTPPSPELPAVPIEPLIVPIELPALPIVFPLLDRPPKPCDPPVPELPDPPPQLLVLGEIELPLDESDQLGPIILGMGNTHFTVWRSPSAPLMGNDLCHYGLPT